MNDAAAKKSIGMIGFLLGVLGLGGALMHFWMGPIETQPPIENVVAEKAANIKKSFLSKLKGEEPVEIQSTQAEVKSWDPDRVVDTVTIIFGFFALVLGALAFILREDKRVAGMAAAFGTGAIAFQFAIVAIGALILVILIAAVLSDAS